MFDQVTQNILESITDEFFAVDREWRFTYINERALNRVRTLNDEELTRKDVLGRSAWEVIPEVVGTVFYEKYHEAVRGQKSVTFEAYSPLSDRWIEVHAYPSEEGLSVYSRDITERKRAEEELRRSEERFRATFEQAAVGIAHTALDGRWLRVNQRLCDILGYTREELLQKSFQDVTHPEDLEPNLGYIERLLAGEIGSFSIEKRYVRKGGSIVWANLTTSLGREPSGEPAYGIAVIEDRTERKRADETLREVREAERHRLARDLHDEALQDLAGAMAHVQLARRATLAVDMGLSERLGRLSSALRRMERQMRAAIYDLGLAADQDRTFPELLQDLVELNRSLAPDLNVRLEVGVGILEGPLGDRGREVLRIIGEALTNARRHSGARDVRVSVWTSGGRLYAEVSDGGRGFEPARVAPSTASGGTGIGGMRERARALDATLDVESELGNGTKVRFEMSLGLDDEGDEGVRVLLVEDHATVREALASSFAGAEGFEIVGQAGSLEEARLALGEAGVIDVAVLDLGLPDGYGGDLIKDLREAHPRAQALVLSVSRDRAEIARAVQAGAASVVHKTAHLERVVEAVRRLRAGETLMPPEEVIELLRFASSRREEEHEAQQTVARLTPREKEVLQALAEGLDSKEIAERLSISLRTQRNHMSRILSKLGVHSQLQALLFAARHGVVEIY